MKQTTPQATHVGGRAKYLLITARSGSRLGFWGSLEKYMYGRLQNMPIDWQVMGIGVIGVMLMASVGTGYYTSPNLSGDELEIVRVAAIKGDYELARTILSEQVDGEKVLGANTELEELVFPEKKLKREIDEWEEKLAIYPTHRDVLMNLGKLYQEMGNIESAREKFEQARILDPNSEIVKN